MFSLWHGLWSNRGIRIVAVIIFAWILTGVGLYCDLSNHHNKIVSSLFQSWLGDVTFFTLIGVATSIVFAIRPEAESFETRARILFQGRHGTEISHAERKLRNLGNYSELTKIQLSVAPRDGWFEIIENADLSIKNLVADIKTSFALPVSDAEQLDNPIEKVGRVISCSINGQLQSSLLSGDANIYQAEVGGNSTTQFCIVQTLWVEDGKHIAYTPQRFTKTLSVEIVNNSDHEIFAVTEIPNVERNEIAPRSRRKIVQATDVDPESGTAYQFYLFARRADAQARLKRIRSA